MKKLNQEQEAIVLSKENKLLIRAPAGSGKTTTLISAVNEYKKNNPDDNVYVLTFTNSAVEELSERIFDRDVKIFTIHSWAYKCLKEIESRNESFKINDKLLRDPEIKNIISGLMQVNGINSNLDVMVSAVMGEGDIQEEIPNFKKIQREYKNYKELRGVYDFTDLCNYLYDTLDNYSEVVRGADALFVDEFQDIDSIQLEIFEAMDCKKKFYIGDPDQSIYMFRTETVGIFEKVSFAKEMELNINYRSKQEIIDNARYIRTIVNKNNNKLPDILYKGVNAKRNLKIKCSRGIGGKVFVCNNGVQKQFDFNDLENPKDKINNLINSGAVILCRYNADVKKLKELGYNRSMTIHKAKGLEFNYVILTGFTVNSLENLNVLYVGMTRAKDVLYFIGIDELCDLLKE